MYPRLRHSFKQRFPFRLSVPSFIYPADYVTNVQRIGAFVDEIELLLFESRPESLPSMKEIDRLAALAIDLNISYNVHLPVDLDLSSTLPQTRRYALERLAAILELVRPLKPTTHTLHLAFNEKEPCRMSIEQWQARTLDTLAALMQASVVGSDGISIETIDYPPAWFKPLVTQLDLAVCLDAGHIVRYGFNLHAILELFSPRITICHLHGVDRGKDHLALNRLAPEHREDLRRFLQSFRGSVSIEVFAFDRLQDSLGCLVGMMDSENGANS